MSQPKILPDQKRPSALKLWWYGIRVNFFGLYPWVTVQETAYYVYQVNMVTWERRIRNGALHSRRPRQLVPDYNWEIHGKPFKGDTYAPAPRPTPQPAAPSLHKDTPRPEVTPQFTPARPRPERRRTTTDTDTLWPNGVTPVPLTPDQQLVTQLLAVQETIGEPVTAPTAPEPVTVTSSSSYSQALSDEPRASYSSSSSSYSQPDPEPVRSSSSSYSSSSDSSSSDSSSYSSSYSSSDSSSSSSSSSDSGSY